MAQVAAHPRHVRPHRRDRATGRPVIACIGHGQDARATRRVAASLARMLRRPLLTASIGPVGEPAEQLMILADRHAAQVLVVAAPDPSAPAPQPLGSVYVALAGAGSCPVLVVPPGVRSLAPGGPVVCGVDGSGPSLVAARVAAWLAESIGAPLHLVKAPTAPILQEGAAAGLLIASAQRKSALLLAVGSRGRSSTVGTLLGPVASAVARTAGTPVLIVPPRADRSHGAPSSVPGV